MIKYFYNILFIGYNTFVIFLKKKYIYIFKKNFKKKIYIYI